jgi:hypothetical protein
MRKVEIGSKRFTTVWAADEPGQGGAHHIYLVCFTDGVDVAGEETPPAEVRFQNGPIKEAGINGCHNEDLIAIVLDRLHGFQSGDFACEANDTAIGHLENALETLNVRTKDRISRGVEGTNVI